MINNEPAIKPLNEVATAEAIQNNAQKTTQQQQQQLTYLVYDDEHVSMEEKRAALPKYSITLKK
ncbi:hypothetical protein D3C80_2107200 [compost metagenome]